MKLVTFSFDDGTLQDYRLVALLNQYGMKGTFNLVSGRWGQNHIVEHRGILVNHSEILASEVKDLYRGHEVACHTMTHPNNLDELSAETSLLEVEDNRRDLEQLVGYSVVGVAYPHGKWSDSVLESLRTQTPIRYGRTIQKAQDYRPPEDWLVWHPSGGRASDPTLIDEIHRFLEIADEGIQILYSWGHSFEFDKTPNGWQLFEDALKLLRQEKNLTFCTNSEVLDLVQNVRRLDAGCLRGRL